MRTVIDQRKKGKGEEVLYYLSNSAEWEIRREDGRVTVYSSRADAERDWNKGNAGKASGPIE